MAAACRSSAAACRSSGSLLARSQAARRSLAQHSLGSPRCTTEGGPAAIADLVAEVERQLSAEVLDPQARSVREQGAWSPIRFALRSVKFSRVSIPNMCIARPFGPAAVLRPRACSGRAIWQISRWRTSNFSPGRCDSPAALAGGGSGFNGGRGESLSSLGFPHACCSAHAWQLTPIIETPLLRLWEWSE